MRNSVLTWAFRAAGLLLATFGAANILGAMLAVVSGPIWLPAFMFGGGVLALTAGVFHATARFS